MKEYRDPLGRPIRRLYLKTDVLDKRCEGVMREFMNRRSGGYRLPIPTDELIRLIEERAGKVDTYANLPEGIHGQTSMYYDRRPDVKIAESIYKTRSDHRVRTTRATSSGTCGFTRRYGARPARGWEQQPGRFGTAIERTSSTLQRMTGRSGRPDGSAGQF